MARSFIFNNWFFNDWSLGRVLGGSQDQVARRLTGRILRRRADGKWEYTSAATERAKTSFEITEEYIWKSQNTVAQYISIQFLLDLCEVTERTPGAQVGMRWWEQVEIDLVGERETSVATVEADKDGMEEWQRGQKRKTNRIEHQ